MAQYDDQTEENNMMEERELVPGNGGGAMPPGNQQTTGGTGIGGRLGTRPGETPAEDNGMGYSGPEWTIKWNGESYRGLTLDYGGRLLTTTTGAYEGQFSREVTLASPAPRGNNNRRNQRRRQRNQQGVTR